MQGNNTDYGAGRSRTARFTDSIMSVFDRLFRRVACICAALALTACASQDIVSGALQEPAGNVQNAERAAAVAEIRSKAAAAQQTETEPDVYQSYAPPERPVRTYAEIKAIEAELQAIAAASDRSSGAAELAALRKRAAYLEKLRQNQLSGLDDEASTGSIDQ